MCPPPPAAGFHQERRAALRCWSSVGRFRRGRVCSACRLLTRRLVVCRSVCRAVLRVRCVLIPNPNLWMASWGCGPSCAYGSILGLAQSVPSIPAAGRAPQHRRGQTQQAHLRYKPQNARAEPSPLRVKWSSTPKVMLLGRISLALPLLGGGLGEELIELAFCWFFLLR